MGFCNLNLEVAYFPLNFRPFNFKKSRLGAHCFEMLVNDFMFASNLRELYLVVGSDCLRGDRRLHLCLDLVARHWLGLHFLRRLSKDTQNFSLLTQVMDPRLGQL
jgi:hypothetical protein